MQTRESTRLLNPHVSVQTDDYAESFACREPFRHVVMDDFLVADYAQQLLQDFPPFERGNARNEAGEPGGKSTVERIRQLGTPYAVLDDFIQTREFLDLVGRLTGIPDLLYDPFYFGGGTHENRTGQDLDPHVDFNRHPIEHWHRRLNLIIYLNPDWQESWGGLLELHSDPRAADDRVKLIAPLFNRCVIFETTECSWHGFSRIAVPIDHPPRTRKSIALYFYTRERPPDELADAHSTVYVDRPLPERFQDGMTLAAADVEELRALIARRDQHNERLYRELASVSKQLEAMKTAVLGGLFGRLRYLTARVLAKLRS
ncbi:MAG: 2OG-Fe(II) oxygenase [Dokdonella sp.]